MRTDIIKMYRLEMWSKDMEGSITPVLSTLYDWMRKLEIGGGLIAGDTSVPKDNPSLEIFALEKSGRVN